MPAIIAGIRASRQRYRPRRDPALVRDTQDDPLFNHSRRVSSGAL